jgi:hypothetical protein
MSEVMSVNDEAYYLKASKEFDSGDLDEALWAKITTLLEGDETKAKYKYIKIRAERLKVEREATVIDAEPSFNFVPEKLIPVSEFAYKNNISEGHAVDLVRGGSVKGERIDSYWFIADTNLGDGVKANSLGSWLSRIFGARTE